MVADITRPNSSISVVIFASDETSLITVTVGAILYPKPEFTIVTLRIFPLLTVQVNSGLANNRVSIISRPSLSSTI